MYECVNIYNYLIAIRIRYNSFQFPEVLFLEIIGFANVVLKGSFTRLKHANYLYTSPFKNYIYWVVLGSL